MRSHVDLPVLLCQYMKDVILLALRFLCVCYLDLCKDSSVLFHRV